MPANMAHSETQTLSAMENIPRLTTTCVESDADKQSALKLVADSIAQQRQVASHYLITRPHHLALLFALYAVGYAFNRSDIILTVITSSGLTLSYLLLIRFLTGDYIQLAEEFRWRSFIRGVNEKEDVVLATKYGKEVIGTLVLRLQPSEGKAAIRAWTVLVRYRGKGVGGGLLSEAVGLARERIGAHCRLEFAVDHANSRQVVSSKFGCPFHERDQRAARALSAALQQPRL